MPTHDIQIHLFLIKEHVLVDGRLLLDLDISVFNRRSGRLHNHLLQMPITSPNKHHGKSACTSRCDCRQLCVKLQYCIGDNWLLTTQRRIHIQPTKIFTNRLQFRLNTPHAGRDETQASLTVSIKTLFDILHELSADRFQRIHAKCGAIARLVRASFIENGVQNVILKINLFWSVAFRPFFGKFSYL
jgi:hypothetical protein